MLRRTPSVVAASFVAALSSALRRLPLPALPLLLLPLLAGCGSGRITTSATNPGSPTSAVVLGGRVFGGQQPISGATMQLYAVGTTGDASAATPLIGTTVLTGSAGEFNITGKFTCPDITSEVYLVASGGNPGLSAGTNNAQAVSMSALGPCGNLSSSTHIVINEASTIGSIFPIKSFMTSYLNVGSSSADALTLADDFMKVNQYINTDGGSSPGPALPPGFSVPVADLYALANVMSACVNSAGGVAGDGTNCGKFLLYAQVPGQPARTNTADAILDIANNPTNNVAQLFTLATAVPAFQPTLSSAPADWNLPILPNIGLSTPSNLVGVGSSNTGTITLGQAAPGGGLTVNFASDNTGAVTVNTPVMIAGGATTGSFTYNGVASGTANITATASGYASGTVQESATASLISLGTIPTVAPGQTIDLPLSLGTPAPAGGVTVNFASTDTGIATIAPASVFIPGGLKVPAANPQVTGVAIGSAQINANATGFAPGARGVTVSVTASFPSTATIPLTTPTNVTLTISAPAPAGGITFNLSSDNTAIFTVPANATIAQGNTTVSVPLTGKAPGTTTLRADSTGIAEATSSVTVNGTMTVQSSTVMTGKLLQVGTYFAFQAVPPGPTTATITSNNPGVAVVSASPTSAGAAQATISNITGTSAQTYYIQGVAVGATTVTVDAPGYTTATINVTVDPSGFVFTAGDFSTTTLSANTTLNIAPAILSPSNSTVLAYAALAPFGNVGVQVASSNTGAGTIITSPVTFVADDTGESAVFHPAGSGTSNVTITQPAGFSIASPSGTQQVVATVSAPPIGTQTSNVISGAGLEVSTYTYLTQTPKVATDIVVTSNNAAVAVVSASATTAGAAQVTLPSVVSTSAQTYYIQGVSVGSTTLTITANAFTSATVNVTVYPSGFVITSPGNFPTTTFSSATSINLAPAILSPGTFAFYGYAALSPNLGAVGVPVASSNTGVGTITTSPVVFNGGDSSQSTTFKPAGAGTSDITLTQPGSFTASSTANAVKITATVSAPPVNYQQPTVTTGVNMEVSTYVYLSQTPPVATTISLTSDTPSVATVSIGANIAGAASTTFPNVVNTAAQTFYIQGQSLGTAKITVSAPGYQSTTINVTVDPSGFVISSPGSINTTTFSSPSSIYITPAILNPGSLTFYGYAALNPGIGTADVAVNSSATQVGTVTSPVSFTGGSTGGTSTFQPVAAGNTDISIVQPAGYSTCSSVQCVKIAATVSAPPIGVQQSNVTTGSNVEVGTYAYLSQTPPSPVTMTLTIADPSIATISTSATVLGSNTFSLPSVSTSAAQTYYIQGHNQGTTSITISAAGYASAIVNVTVGPSGFVISNPGNFSTTTFSSPTTINVAPAILNTGSLTFYGYAALNPGIGNVQVAIGSSNTGAGTVSTPITFTPGSTGATSSFQPVGSGTTTLSLTTPGGFTTDSQPSYTQISATVTAPSIGVQNANPVTGASMQISTYGYLTVTPPSPVTLTVTSNNPAIVTVSKSALVAGGAAIQFTGLSATSAQTYYVQGQSVGSTTLTLSAPGYNDATVNVTVDPSGFVLYTGNFNTTTFSSPASVYVSPAILNAGVLTFYGYAAMNPSVSAAVNITSSLPGVGTVTSPVQFNPGDTSSFSTFQPTGPGTTTLSIATPAGFTSPSQSSNTQISATVTAPSIGVQNANPTLGANLEVNTYTYLTVTPPSPVTVTVTSNNPAIALVAPNSTTAGSSSISFAAIQNTAALQYSLQGVAVGSTTLTITAPGYAPTTVNVTVDPSGFVIYTPGNFSTTAGGSDTNITIEPAVLSPGVLTVIDYQMLSPSAGAVGVQIGSTSPQIGTVNPGTLNFTAGVSSLNTSFHPLMAGSTDVVIVAQPSGFTTPSQPATQQIVVTVQ